jgi:hypothetical protein
MPNMKKPIPGLAKKAEKDIKFLKEVAKKEAAKKTTTKAPAKKKVVQMPSKISPSKMTPAQKAKYLQNPERYDK